MQLEDAVTLETADPYSQTINNFLSTEFPSANFGLRPNKIDTLTNIFVSTQQVRFGPIPSPETLVTMRDTLRYYVAANLPIPILVPWGGRKTMARSVDVADFMALRQLKCLDRSIRQHYAPGLTIRIRIEDSGAYYLYANESDDIVTSYSHALRRLITVLHMGNFCYGMFESDLMPFDVFEKKCDAAKEVLLDYLHGIDGSFTKLQELGWQGQIPAEQRMFYLERYKTFNAALTPDQALEKLAAYFATSLTRYKMNGSCVDASWVEGGYVQINFVPPVPGAPQELTKRTIYYRTIPERMARTHIAPWRGYGYFMVGAVDVTPKITSFRANLHGLHQHRTELKFGTLNLNLNTDYILSKNND